MNRKTGVTTWGDVLRILVLCAAVLSAVMAIIWAMETNMEIRSLQSDVEALKAAKRPLVAVDGGKYLTIFTQEKEVVIETTNNRSQ